MDLERFQYAISLSDSGRNEDAARELHAMAEDLRNGPDSERGLILLNEAICLGRLGRPLEEAKSLLNEASALLGGDRTMRALVDYTDASFYMGYRDRDPAKALQKFDAVLRTHAEILREPKTRDLLYGEIQLRRGFLLLEFKRYQEARVALEDVLGLNVEKDAEFYFDLGRCYTELHEWTAAAQRLLQALDMGLSEDRLVRAHFYVGTVYYHTKAYGKALQEFEYCEANISKSTMPARVLYKWLALTCQTVGREEDARRYSHLAAKG
jgi:tetratricopeptide (TPR) repeat protein